MLFCGTSITTQISKNDSKPLILVEETDMENTPF